MSRSQLLFLLSSNYDRDGYKRNKDEIVYYVGVRSVKIFFRDDKVYQWCFCRGSVESAPHFDNVVLVGFDEPAGQAVYDSTGDPIVRPKK